MPRFAASVALRMASGTSLALPLPKPTRPFWSPTTTSAAKPKRLPPFTVLETRLMATRRSANSGFSSRRPPRWPPRCGSLAMWPPVVFGAVRPCCPTQCQRAPVIEGGVKPRPTVSWSRRLQLQPGLARGIRQRLDPAVVEKAATVEIGFFDARHLRTFGDGLPDLRRGFDGVLAENAEVLLERRGRRQGLARDIVDELNLDVLRRAVHRQADLAGVDLAKLAPDAHAALLEQIPFGKCHVSGPYFFLPSLRKMNSPL